MALQQCRFCDVSVNGLMARMYHERTNHPKQHWQAKAEACRNQARKLTEQADRYDQRASKEE